LLSVREQLVVDSIYDVKETPLKLREFAEVNAVTAVRLRQIFYKSPWKISD
jgi:hypothetical protein